MIGKNSWINFLLTLCFTTIFLWKIMPGPSLCPRASATERPQELLYKRAKFRLKRKYES